MTTTAPQQRISRSSATPQSTSKIGGVLSKTAKNGRERSAQRLTLNDLSPTSISTMVEPTHNGNRRSWTVINKVNDNHVEDSSTSSSCTASSVDSGLSHHSVVLSKPAKNMASTTTIVNGHLPIKNDTFDGSSSSSPHFGVIFRSYDQRTFNEKRTSTISPTSGAHQVITETRSVQRSKPVQYEFGNDDDESKWRAVADHNAAMKPLYISAKVKPIVLEAKHAENISTMSRVNRRSADNSPPALRYTSTFSLVRTPPQHYHTTADTSQPLSSSTIAAVDDHPHKTQVTEEVETVETVVLRIPLTRNGPLTSSGRRPKHYLHKPSVTTVSDQQPDEIVNNHSLPAASSSDDDEDVNRTQSFRRSRRRRRLQDAPTASSTTLTGNVTLVNSKDSATVRPAYARNDAKHDLNFQTGSRIFYGRDGGRETKQVRDIHVTEGLRAPRLLSASSTFISRRIEPELTRNWLGNSADARQSERTDARPLQSGSITQINAASKPTDENDDKNAAEEYFFSDNEADQDAKFGSSKRNNSIRSKVGIFRSTQQLSTEQQQNGTGNGTGNISRRPSFSGSRVRPSTFNSNLVAQRVQHYSNLSASQRALMQGESVPPVSLQTRPLHQKSRSQSIGQLPSWPPPAPSASYQPHNSVESTAFAGARRSSASKATSREPMPVGNYPSKIYQSVSQLSDSYEPTGSLSRTAAATPSTLPKQEKHSFNMNHQSSVRRATLAYSEVVPSEVIKPVPAVRRRESLTVKQTSNNTLHPVPSAAIKQRQRVFQASSIPVEQLRKSTASATQSERQPTEKRTSLSSDVEGPVLQSSAASSTPMSLTQQKSNRITIDGALATDRSVSKYERAHRTPLHAAKPTPPTTIASLNLNAGSSDANSDDESKPVSKQAKVMVNHRDIAPAASNNPTVSSTANDDDLLLPPVFASRRRDSVDSGKSSSSSGAGESSNKNVLQTTIVSNDNTVAGIDISDVNSRMSLLLTSLTQIRAQLINQPAIECEQVALQRAAKQQAQLAAVLHRKADVVATIRREANQALLSAAAVIGGPPIGQPPTVSDWRYKTLSLKLDELDRLWRAVGQFLRRRETTIVALIGRLQEFDDAAEASDRTLRRYEYQLREYDALSDTERRDSERHAENIKQLQDSVESMRRQIDVVQEMALNFESAPHNDDDDEPFTLMASDSTLIMPKALPNIDTAHVQQAALELRERHEHVLLELGQRLAVLDVASNAVKNFESACAKLQRYLDTKDDELDDVEANDVVGRDSDVVGRQVDEIHEFLRQIERCERDELEKLRKMIEDIVARGYSTAANQLEMNLDKLSRQWSKLKDRAHARTEDVELMLDKLKNLFDDAASLMLAIDTERQKVISAQKLREGVQQHKASTSSHDDGKDGTGEKSDGSMKQFLAERFEPMRAKFTKIRSIGQTLLSTAPPGVTTSTLQLEVDKLDRTWNLFADTVDQWQQTLQSNRIAHEKWHDECDDVANKIIELELALSAARPPVLDAAVLEEQLHGQQFFERMADTARSAFESLCQLTAEFSEFSSSAPTKSENSASELENRLSAVDEQIEFRRIVIVTALPLMKLLYTEQLPKFRQAANEARRQIDDLVDKSQQSQEQPLDFEAAHAQLHQKLIVDVQSPLVAIRNTASQLEDLSSKQNGSQSTAPSLKVDCAPLRTLVQDYQDQYNQLIAESEGAVTRANMERQIISTFDTDCNTLIQWLNTLEAKVRSTLENVPSCYATDNAIESQQPNYEVLLSLVRDDLEDIRKLLEHVTAQLNDMQREGKISSESCRAKVDITRQSYAKLSDLIESQLVAAAEQQTLANELHEVHRTLCSWFARAEIVLEEVGTEEMHSVHGESAEDKLRSLRRDAADALSAVDAMRATYARLQEIRAATSTYDKDMPFFNNLLRLIADDERRIHTLVDATAGGKT